MAALGDIRGILALLPPQALTRPDFEQIRLDAPRVVMHVPQPRWPPRGLRYGYEIAPGVQVLELVYERRVHLGPDGRQVLFERVALGRPV